LAANSVFSFIEYIANKENQDEFFFQIDYFYSLYNIWKSHAIFEKIDELYEQLEEIV
jgi:hypothetical protein